MTKTKINGAKLKALRKKHGITLKELGIEMGFSEKSPHAYLSEIENGVKAYYDEKAIIKAMKKVYKAKYKQALNIDSIC